MARKRASKQSTQPQASPDAPHSMRAPAERWRHSDREERALDANRPRWKIQRVINAADRLLTRGDITETQHAAFNRYRHDYELGLYGVSAPERRGNGGGVRDFMDVKVAAVHALRLADQALGEQGRAVMLLFAVHGMSYSAAESRLTTEPDNPLGSPDRERLKVLLVNTLDLLARHYSGDLYRVRPVLEPEVAEVMEARIPRRDTKPMDLQAMRKAVMSRMTEYARLDATPDAVALLLRSEFGDWAEVVLEVEDA